MLTMSKRAVAKLVATSDATAISQVPHLQVVLVEQNCVEQEHIEEENVEK